MRTFLFSWLLLLLAVPSMADDVPAFPGAEGHGRFVTGGRGGEIRHVTTLLDDGNNNTKGTLRWAVNGSAKKTVVFDVGGVIALTKDLKIGANTTIAGQTAPAPGITIRYFTVKPNGNNIIIRFIRIRRGQEKNVNDGADAITAQHYTGLLLDHCSFSWSIDEVASFYDNNNFTMQWCTIGESLNNAGHEKGAHGYGGIWGGKLASFHHNLICHVNNRSPRFCGARYEWSGYTSNNLFGSYQWKNHVQSEIVDFRNCVVYNSGNGCYGGPGGGYVNMVNNYYKTGPATSTSRFTTVTVGAPGNSSGHPNAYGMTSRYFLSGNFMYGNTSVTNNNWNGVTYDARKVSSNESERNDGVFDINGEKCSLDTFNFYGNEVTHYMNAYGKACVRIKLDKENPKGTVTTHTAANAFEKVLAYAGASLCRDEVDTRFMTETRNGTATYSGSVTKKKGRIDLVSDVNGYTESNFGTGSRAANYDTDGDGMPDEWETAHGLNPSDNTDGAAYTLDERGWYTNVEVFMNSLVEDIMKQGNADATESVDEYYPPVTSSDDPPVTTDKAYCPFNTEKNNVTGEQENPEFTALNLTSNALSAGTVIGRTIGVTARIGGADTYKKTSYGPITVAGYTWSGGIQGTENPKDNTNNSPANSLKAPVTGAFFTFDVTEDGFLYVTHRASSNKAYTVFEDQTPVGYIFSAVGDGNKLSTQYGYELKGSGSDNSLLAANIQKVLFPEQIYLNYDGTGDWTEVKYNSMSVIKFPVRSGHRYAVNANGSKMTATGFYFDTTGDATVTSPSGTDNIVLLDKGYLPGTVHFLLGDVNDDGSIDISDITALANYILGNIPPVFIEQAADVNGDGDINISDITQLVNYILSGN